MYPYDLGCYLKTGKLCRIPKYSIFGTIPSGTVRIVWYHERIPRIKRIAAYKYNPYGPDGELLPQYWSIHRNTDLDRMKESEAK